MAEKFFDWLTQRTDIGVSRAHVNVIKFRDARRNKNECLSIDRMEWREQLVSVAAVCLAAEADGGEMRHPPTLSLPSVELSLAGLWTQAAYPDAANPICLRSWRAEDLK
jgi:hypothetical protein